MDTIAGVDIYGVRGQVIIMLLQILRLEGACARQQATECIAQRGWFNIKGDDLAPYPTQHEPRWRTLVAWARKDSFESHLLSDSGFDNWQLSSTGRALADSLKQRFGDRRLDVRRCYMWRPAFKRYMFSTYEPSTLDSERPPYIYEDQVSYSAVRQALWLLEELQRRAQRSNT
jgi:hypothetical protein